jgi:hypothetical protein
MPPQGPPPQHAYMPPHGPPPQQQAYMPPSGPPPSHEFAPPSGPPPGQYAAPEGPPPSKMPEHNWQAFVPDTSLLPPPPTMGHEQSHLNNATEDDAARGMQWCQQRPLAPAMVLTPESITALNTYNFSLIKGPNFSGDLRPTKPGHWTGHTKAGSPDTCLISQLPLYSVYTHSPLQTRNIKIIYFEVYILPSNRSEVDLGLGFVAAPYPQFRLPGWERASLGVHGDDGHRYVNDKWGGKDFTTPFRPGQTLGIGMKFSPRQKNDAPPAYDDAPVQAQTTTTSPINVEIFFTKDGVKDGGWNLHEEGDADQDLPITGLEGMNDLYASVGTFDSVDFEVIFNESDWKYSP